MPGRGRGLKCQDPGTDASDPPNPYGKGRGRGKVREDLPAPLGGSPTTPLTDAKQDCSPSTFVKNVGVSSDPLPYPPRPERKKEPVEYQGPDPPVSAQISEAPGERKVLSSPAKIGEEPAKHQDPPCSSADIDEGGFVEYQDSPTQTDVEIPEGYLDPMSVEIPTTLSDSVLDNPNGRLCVAPIICTPSEFYLTFVDLWPNELDSFAKEMSKFYNSLKDLPLRYIVPPSLLERGAIVAVYDKRNREWMRGRFKRPCPSSTDNAALEPLFRVNLIDIGETIEVGNVDIFYLHEKFATKHELVIPCRIFVDREERRAMRLLKKKKTWDTKNIALFYLDLAFKTVKVNFVNRIYRHDHFIWEVQILQATGDPQ